MEGCGGKLIRLADGLTLTVNGEAYSNHSARRAWSIRNVGASVQRFELREGDHWSVDGSTKDRAELRHMVNQPFDNDIWLSYSMRVTGTLPADWLVVGQFHDEHDTGEPYRTPPLAAEIVNGQFVILTRSDTDAISSTSNIPGTTRFVEPFTLNEWMHLVWRFRFSKTGQGYLQVWRDGEEIIPGAVIPLGFNDEIGHYFKYGIYRKAETSTVVGEFANVEIGPVDLSDRVLNPLPIT